jgi:Pectate lyase superfamily protein
MFVFFGLCCVPAECQFTTNTATVVDPDSIAWATGTWSVQFTPSPSQPNLNIYNINGTPLNQALFLQTGTLSPSAGLTQQLYDNNLVSPSGSTWTYTICPRASAPCTILPPVTVTGATQNISAFINSNIKGPRFPANGANAFGYADLEVSPAPVPGSFYWNVLQNQVRYWNGSNWIEPGVANAIFQLPRVDVRYANFGTGTYVSSLSFSGTTGCTSSSTISISSPFFQTGTQATIGQINLGPDNSTPVFALLSNQGGGYSASPIPTATITGCTTPGTITVNLASCTPGIADPTGTTDSTCAIQQAIDYALSVYPPNTSGPFPQVYFPAGTYNVSTAIRAPGVLDYAGDSKSSTIIRTTQPSIDGFFVYRNGANTPGVGGFGDGGAVHDIQFTTNLSGTIGQPYIGYTGTFLEVSGTVTNFAVHDVEFTNGGGRCLAFGLASEELRVQRVKFNACRWPLAGMGQASSTFNDIYANGPGENATGYCFGSQCQNGVWHSQTWNPTTVSLTNVTTDGAGNATFTVTCTPTPTCLQHGVNGTSAPIAVGHWFRISGITTSGFTLLNGNFQATAISGSPGSPFTITTSTISPPVNAPNGGLISGGAFNYGPDESIIRLNTTLQTPAAGSTTSLSGAIFLPSIFPSANFALVGGGPATNVNNLRCDTLWFANCLQVPNPGIFTWDGGYAEGFASNGWPVLNHMFSEGGYIPYTVSTSSLAGSSTFNAIVPVISTQWFLPYANDPTDLNEVQNDSNFVDFCPKDYNPNQTGIPSAFVTGVNTNQCEILSGLFMGDGAWHVNNRNVGSLVPAGVTWPAGSLVGYSKDFSPLTGGGLAIVRNIHTSDMLPGNANWDTQCSDAGPNTCGSFQIGVDYDNIMLIPPTQTGSYNQSFKAQFTNVTSTNCGANTSLLIGQNCIKILSQANIATTGVDSSQNTQKAELPAVLNGSSIQSIAPGVINVIRNVQGTPMVSQIAMSDNHYHSSLNTMSTTLGSGWLENTLSNIASANSTGLGTAIDGSAPVGHQFSSTDNWYDIGGFTTTASITSWAVSGTTVVFQATNSLVAGNCIVISGLSIGATFNSESGNCQLIIARTGSSFTINIAPLIIPASLTGATESGTAVNYHAAIRDSIWGGVNSTPSQVGRYIGFWNGSTYVTGFSVTAVGDGSGHAIVTIPASATFNCAASGCGSVSLQGTSGVITGTSIANACDSGTVSITGAVQGHPVSVSIANGADIGANFVLRASVTSANTVTIFICNPTAIAATPPSTSYNVSTF